MTDSVIIVFEGVSDMQDTSKVVSGLGPQGYWKGTT